MPSFVLEATERNLKIAELVGSRRYVKVNKQNNSILVQFEEGLMFSRIEVDDATEGITDREWRNLAKEIKRSLKGAKVRELTDQIMGIQPLRKEGIFLRLTPIERSLIRKAAKLEHRTVSDFTRMAVLNAADNIFDRKRTLEKAGKPIRKKQDTKTLPRCSGGG